MKEIKLIILVTLLIGIGYLMYKQNYKKIPEDNYTIKTSFMDNLLDTRYLEIYVIGGNRLNSTFTANCYNSTHFNLDKDVDNSAPQSLMNKLDISKITEEFNAFNTYINGPRAWCIDWLKSDSGKTRNFNGLKAKWIASLEMVDPFQFNKEKKPFNTFTFDSNAYIGFRKGTKVFLLNDSLGNTWIMQSFNLKSNPSLNHSDISKAMKELNLPKGWNYSVTQLDKELILHSESGFSKAILDDHENIYELTGKGYSNYVPK